MDISRFSWHDGFCCQKNEFIKNYIDIPDKLVDLLIRFLAQNGGKLSKRRREREFKKLTSSEIQAIENKYAQIFD
jgi:hypothetical protein